MKTIMWIAFAFICNLNAFAQLKDTDKPYWKVYTDAIAKQTTVNFFNADRHLVYQEVIDEQYIKLTKRNRRKLDHILFQVTQQNLVASATKLAILREPVRKIPYVEKNYTDNNWRCNSTIIQQSWLQVNVQNPKGTKLSIKLYNLRGESIFKWSFSRTDYKLYNLELLRPGTYQLVITDGQNTYSQDISVSSYPSRKTLLNATYTGTFASN